ncbi:acyl-CoA thioesterase II [Talaromyces proteolyticus]|uniref:Acyl-CoA thioesterase II n=1 Tax=Talaromyces proteolyticus TaxID=1131652 RepID=A0AAD4KTD3_9EURO|nr:acyl-CoA thioesterase II [Talaromyces proteolyticus]KAH8698911.1 acyl-CoA thioesterase II [Talaromyces proteolyticus]
MASKRVTVFESPPLDDSKASIENVLELTPILDIGPDVFTNTRPLWHPPGARGIFGGAVIAQSLCAAQRTVPEHFYVHSMHCYFVLAGDSEIPIIYHVERVRTGKSYATRTVQARQRGRPIFTTTLSFNKIQSGGDKKVEHGSTMPVVSPPKNTPTPPDARSPFETQRLDGDNSLKDTPIDERRLYQWVRFRGEISESGGHQAHLSALAYMSDSYFIGTVARVHGIPRFSSPAALQRVMKALKNPSDLDGDGISRYFKELAEEEAAEIRASTINGTLTANKLSSIIKRRDNREIGMMVSLDHTIYFHDPLAFRADDWMLCRMESPWAGEGRGLVMQKIWSKDGVHIATCVQEGVVRLRQDEEARDAKL